MVDEFDDNLHYKVGDVYRTGTNLYIITGHKPCSECRFPRLNRCAGKAIFTNVKSKYPYEVCGIQGRGDGTFKKVYSKVEITNIRW
ncbi:hypothetical protein GQ473_05125 [archaeon]|nr:hypothetical protein [archaeon]